MITYKHTFCTHTKTSQIKGQGTVLMSSVFTLYLHGCFQFNGVYPFLLKVRWVLGWNMFGNFPEKGKIEYNVRVNITSGSSIEILVQK